MKSLFDIQTESGQLWLDISAQLDALRKEGADALAAAQATAKEAADKAAADAATAKAASDATIADANAARDKAVTELAAMTAQDQKHATALLAALDWTAIDAEYADLQTKLAAINAPFAAREAAAKAARVKELEAQLAAVK
jgi:hypothetical protein